MPSTSAIACAASALLALPFLHAQNAPAPQGVPENAVMRVSDHVHAILGFPNIVFVVGSRGTLVVDTGMGVPNGTIVVREARKLAKGPNLYLTTTHFHPEHAAGEQAFPAQTVIIRPAAQQQELEKHGEEFLEMFRGFNPQFKKELQDVKFRAPDIVFDREVKLDLGGVTARLFWLGAAHTLGDELIFVEPDSALITGDIVQNKIVPNMPNADATVKGWLSILDQLGPLKPRFVVPDHGALGDGSLIGKERAFLADLQGRALALKRQGTSVDDAAKMLTAEFKTKYPDWQTMGPVANVVRRVYAEAP
ncbi:MAG TPA: MBL fold metallo-hydrolase [Bryobacteraceae bacterium]|jgi:glyoxylase-like metal-dependent hydrolase (beta-lactamase superfamily II)|nr:MBL fold metallo-hydrolase [Bryobacteraceae bacterium]